MTQEIKPNLTGAINQPVVEAEVPPSGSEIVEASQAEERTPNWLRRHIAGIAIGTLLVGSAVSAAISPLGPIEKDIVDAAPYAGAAIGVSEALWILGAGTMAGSAGQKVGNPFKLRRRWGEISQTIVDSRTFKVGLAVNTLGALGTAATVAVGAAVALPPETWPGAVALAAADIAGTVALRAPIVAAMRGQASSENTSIGEAISNKEKEPKAKVRTARLEDIDRLADLDILLFDKAYGSEKPQKQEIVEMLTRRLNNNPGWMFVAEVDGVVEGFVSAFLTNKPLEEFVSWEETTNNGTLDGVVDPKGKYAYVTNMTLTHNAVTHGAEEMLLAQLFANGIEAGVKYGYFVSRMPLFKGWLRRSKIEPIDAADEKRWADEYANLRVDGKRKDRQLRMYEDDLGFELVGDPVPNAFEDAASLNFGVVCRANVPSSNPLIGSIKPVRWGLAAALRQVAKHPKLLKKII